MSHCITTWQVETVMGTCSRNGRGLQDLQIHSGPLSDSICVVMFNVLLSIHHFFHKCSFSDAPNFTLLPKKIFFCAETFCLVYQNTRVLKLITGYLTIAHVPSLMLHFILIQF